MKPIINLEEKIGKTVGRRVPPKDSFAFAMGLQESMVNLGKELKVPFVPRGVFRFRTFEEADAWMLKMLARRRK